METQSHRRRVYISGRGLLSTAGSNFKENCLSLRSQGMCFSYRDGKYLGQRSPEADQAIAELLKNHPQLRKLDPAAIMAIMGAREALTECANYGSHWGVVFGSSRGPTHKLEQAILDFYGEKRLPAYTSPVTTANTIPSSLARFFCLNGMHLFVSAACSTGLQAIGLATGLIQSGQLSGCIAGAVETSNTLFVKEIMERTKVTHDGSLEAFPYRPMAADSKGMVMGEGVGALILESNPKNPICEVIGFGAATDDGGMAGVSKDARGLQLAINRSLKAAGIEKDNIDLIVGHGSGTQKGDEAEWKAIKSVFKDTSPAVTFHKWLTGHMLGASSASSVALASAHLADELPIDLPYQCFALGSVRPQIKIAMVLSLGFGGNAAALIIRRLKP